MNCHCDFEPPSFYRSDVIQARKAHRCDECDGIILPKEKYERVTGMWDGSIGRFKTCLRCIDLRTWVQNNLPCVCYALGQADEGFRESIREAYRRAGDEVVGLRFGFARRVAAREYHNRIARLTAGFKGVKLK